LSGYARAYLGDDVNLVSDSGHHLLRWLDNLCMIHTAVLVSEPWCCWCMEW